MNLEARLEGLLTTAELAARPDFALGQTVVSPSTRTVRGPGGRVDVEPRVMQVLVVLADADGAVVTRDALFHRCWGSPHVGDDSLNRAIAGVRRLASGVGGGSFEVETVPRTGYRLTVEDAGSPSSPPDDAGSSGNVHALSRRALIGSGVAVAAVTAGGGLWLVQKRRSDERFNDLIARAVTALRSSTIDQRTIRSLEEAVATRPESARAWGLLALLNSILAPGAAPEDAARMIDRAQNAALRALSLDPRETSALLAMFELQGSTLDWHTRDQRLRQIIAIDTNYVPAIAELVLLLQSAGMNRESWEWNERAIALEPLSYDFLGKRALKHWIAGRVAEADKVIDQVRALYPTNRWAWWARFLIFAMTDRPLAAKAMLESNPRMIPDAVEAKVWEASLTALVDRSATTIAGARQACFDGARSVDQLRGQGTMILCALGEVDAAFEIANGHLLARGPVIRRENPGSNTAAQDAFGRVNMQWMFTPPCAVMRADARFGSLCDGTGLTEYWRRRGVRPDYQVDGA